MRRIIVLSFLTFTACTSRTPSGPERDGGIVLRDDDAGLGGGADAGGDPSSGDGGVRADARVADARVADSGATPSDGGPSTCGEPIAMLREELLPRCSVATRECITACAESTCMRSCATADGTAPHMVSPGRFVNCEFCLSWQQKRCIDTSGCHPETAALQCCLEAHCPDGSCLTTTCSAQNAAWSSCAMTTAASCLAAPVGGEYAVCYPTTTP